MHVNDAFFWPRSTAKSHERVTAIENIVQNFYWLTFLPVNRFYRYIAHPYIFVIKGAWTLVQIDLVQFKNSSIVKHAL